MYMPSGRSSEASTASAGSSNEKGFLSSCRSLNGIAASLLELLHFLSSCSYCPTCFGKLILQEPIQRQNIKSDSNWIKSASKRPLSVFNADPGKNSAGAHKAGRKHHLGGHWVKRYRPSHESRWKEWTWQRKIYRSEAHRRQKGATISKMFVEKGEPLVTVNQHVEKGQMLVSGLIGSEEEKQKVGAKGKSMVKPGTSQQ